MWHDGLRHVCDDGWESSKRLTPMEYFPKEYFLEPMNFQLFSMEVSFMSNFFVIVGPPLRKIVLDM